MKYRGHETFSIRRNWLPKGILALNDHKDLFTSKERDPMNELGIGRNMVLSLRYWLQAVGIAEEVRAGKRQEMRFTQVGNAIFRYDRFVEETGTLWTLHYELAKNLERATAWYFFFNEFELSEFTKEDFVRALENFDRMHGGNTAVRSFEDDFECILKTYMTRGNSGSLDPEDNIESPFAELGLIDSTGKTYRKIIPPKEEIPLLIFLLVLSENADKFPNGEIPLNEIENGIGNAGKIFDLDTVTLMELLGGLENEGFAQIVRTAGIDVVRISKKWTATECLEKYYEELGK